jgi:hypothetical protein
MSEIESSVSVKQKKQTDSIDESINIEESLGASQYLNTLNESKKTLSGVIKEDLKEEEYSNSFKEDSLDSN